MELNKNMARYLAPIAGCVLLGAAVAGGLLPQDQDQPIIRTDVRLVMAPVTVTDRGGAIVNGLTLRDFRLLDNGKRQDISEDVVTHPISMVIAVQANTEVEKMLPMVQ